MSELFNRVNWVDVFALILLIKISYVSSHIGVGKQLVPFALLVLILTIALYYYQDIANFFIERSFFDPAVCRFFAYVLAASPFYALYIVTLRMTRILVSGERITGGIERVGGAIVGMLRASIIIGIVLIGFLLAPVKALEDSIKYSYSAFFFVETDLKIYAVLRNLIFRNDPVSHRQVLAELCAEKKKYIFERIDVRKKSKFFNNKTY